MTNNLTIDQKKTSVDCDTEILFEARKIVTDDDGYMDI